MFEKFTTVISENKTSLLRNGLIVGGVAIGLTLVGAFTKNATTDDGLIVVLEPTEDAPKTTKSTKKTD